MKNLILFVLLFSACTPKEVPVREHSGARLTAPAPREETPSQNLVQDRKGLSEQFARGESLERIYSLADKVLSDDFVQDSRANSDDSVAAVSLFQQGLLQLIKNQAADPKVIKLAERYKDFVLQDCDTNGNQCTNLGYFANKQFTSDIFVVLAKGKADQLRQTNSNTGLDEYYKMLRLGALATRNRVKNQEVDLLYVEFASRYTKHLEAKGKQTEKLLERHNIQLNEILLDLSSQGVAGEKRKPYCDFVLQSKSLSKELAGEFIRCASERKILRQTVTQFVESERAKVKAKDGNSQDITFAQAIDFLKTKKPHVLNAMGVKSEALDPYVEFVLNSVFYDRMDLNTAIQYWRAQTDVTDAQFISQAREYIQIQILYLVQSSQMVLAEEMKTQLKKRGGLSTDFFADTLDSVNQKTQFPWQDLKLRVGRTKDFMMRLFDEKYGFRAQGQVQTGEKGAAQDYIQLKHQLDSVGTHLSVTSVASMMLPVNYYLSRANGSIKIFIPWWRGSNQWFEIDSRGALSRLIDYGGDLAQLFNYGEQSYRFDPLQSIYVVDVALRNGIFDTVPLNLIETAEDKNLSEENEYLFFKRYLFETLDVFRSSLQSGLRDLEILETSEEFRSFLGNICENPLHAYANMTLSQLQSGTLQTGPLTDSIVKKIYMDRKGENYQVAREQAERVLKIFRQHFFGENAENRLSAEKLSKRTAILAAMEKEYDRYFQIERKYNRKWVQLDKKVVTGQRDCIMRIYRADWYRRYKIYDLNIEFYRDVHAAMSVLRAVKSSDANDSAPDYLSQVAAEVAAKIQHPEVRLRALRLLEMIRTTGLLAVHAADVNGSKLESSLNDLLGVHNNGTTPYVVRDSSGRVAGGVGYFVTGVGEAPKSKAIKRMNWIGAENFRQGKWDSLVRVRRQLQITEVPTAEIQKELGLTNVPESRPGYTPLAPNIDVTLNSINELENDTQFYGNIVRDDVTYKENPEEFVRLAMIQFGGWHTALGQTGGQHISWHSPSGSNLEGLRSRTRLLFSANRSEWEYGEQKACSRDKWERPIAGPDCDLFKIPADEAIKYFLSWADLLNMNERDRGILLYLQWPSRFGDLSKEYFANANELTTTRWTYFDEIYRRHYSSTSVARDGRTPSASDYREELDGKRDFLSWLNSKRIFFKPENHLFAVNNDFMSLTRHLHRARVMRHLEAVKAFEKTVAKIEDGVAQNQIAKLADVVIEREIGSLRQDENYDFDNYRIMRVRTRSEGPRSGTPIYLRDDGESPKEWFWSFVRSFNVKDADCEFLPSSTDPDFVPGSDNEKAECSQRFLQWKDQVLDR